MKTRYIVGSILIIALIIAGIAITRSFSTSPTNTFEMLVTKPVPSTVTSIESGHFGTMDSSFWALRFQIGKDDLRALLDNQHFAPVNETEEFKSWDVKSNAEVRIQKEQYLKLWRKRILNTAKLDVNFTTNWLIYTLKEEHGQKYMFCDTNSNEAVFVADAH